MHFREINTNCIISLSKSLVLDLHQIEIGLPEKEVERLPLPKANNSF